MTQRVRILPAKPNVVYAGKKSHHRASTTDGTLGLPLKHMYFLTFFVSSHLRSGRRRRGEQVA